jgi:hypothetical protein
VKAISFKPVGVDLTPNHHLVFYGLGTYQVGKTRSSLHLDSQRGDSGRGLGACRGRHSSGPTSLLVLGSCNSRTTGIKSQYSDRQCTANLGTTVISAKAKCSGVGTDWHTSESGTWRGRRNSMEGWRLVFFTNLIAKVSSSYKAHRSH